MKLKGEGERLQMTNNGKFVLEANEHTFDHSLEIALHGCYIATI